MHGFAAVSWLTEQLGFDDPIERGFRDTTHAEVLSSRAVPRLYLYSKADRIVNWRDVGEHAQIARRAGCVVYMVLFRNSMHVAHIKEDETKYWSAVRQIVERENTRILTRL